MTDLTQDWKDGKLLGLYWCKITVSPYIEIVYVDGIDNIYITEVLAKVPSYDEWMEIKNVYFDNEILRLEKENKELKTQIAKLTKIVGVLPLNHSVSNLGYKIKNQRHEINNRIKEIDKLKELLRECYKMLAQYHVENSEPSLDENIQLLTKIDNAIGEK